MTSNSIKLAMPVGLAALLIVALLPAGSQPRAAVSPATATHVRNAGSAAVPTPPGLIGFLLSTRGRRFLRLSSHPMAKELLRRLGEGEPPWSSKPAPEVLTELPSPPESLPQPQAAGPCSTAAGTWFNREPRTPPGALPQNGTVIDFLPGAGISGADLVVGAASDIRGIFGGLGNSATGYYVHRNGADPDPCSPDFEGGAPPLRDQLTGSILVGAGDPALEADPPRSGFFLADLRFRPSVSAIGLFRTTAGRLRDPAACPDGTHNVSAAKACWPIGVEVNEFANGSINVKPHIAVDPRPLGSGAGAGDVYVAATLGKITSTSIILTACTNSLSACSSPIEISGLDSAVQAAHVQVRPDASTNPGGSVTVTYVNIFQGTPPDFLQSFSIKYVTCTPQSAPNAPSCSAPGLITEETQPIPSTGGGLGGGSLAAAQFMISTYPKHAHRMDANGVETYVVWDRCHVQNILGGDRCPDADLRVAASNNNGGAWAFGDVDAGPGDQFFPWIRTDTSNTLNIAYYSSQADPQNHRPQVLLRQIPPGPATPDNAGAPKVVAALPMEPGGDFFFGSTFIGSNIGLSARATATGMRAYVHFVHTIVNGIYNGAPAPEQNNHLGRLDY